MPWHVLVRLEDIPETGRRITIEADENTRAAIAKLAGLRALPRLTADFEVTRHGRDGLEVAGKVSATVGQVCVVTLEPIDNEVTETVNVVFEPARAIPGAPSGPRPGKSPAADAEAEDTEWLVDGVADLGAVATEFLLLGINPYPRKPGAVFEPPAPGETPPGPFAALAALKRGGAGES